MNRRASSLIFIKFAALLLLNTSACLACQTGSVTITNLPAIPGAAYQVFGLNAAGQLTGFFSIASDHAGQAFLYSGDQLTDLGTLGGSTSQGHWINGSGQIVGQAALLGDTQFHAFLSGSGTLLDLGTLGGPSSSASAINDAGVVVGESDLAAGAGSSAFIYINGALTSLGNFGSNYSSAFALNNANLVVGESALPSGDVHGFTYLNGTLSDLGTLGGNYSSAFAVNDAGQVVGESRINGTDVHGFFFQGGVMSDVGTFGGTYSSTFLVNSNGQAVGISTTTGDAETHAFIYAAGTLTDLGTLGGGYCSPNDINNRGQVVGQSLTASSEYHAFLWDNGKLTDLNDLLPANSGWNLANALYINDSGRIVGLGDYAGMSQWFILDPPAANKPPVAVAGPDQMVDCQSQVTLDGSGSSDPDNDPLTFEWSFNGNLLGTSAKLGLSLPLGTNIVTLKVTDTCGASSQANVTIVVADTTPPSGSCPAAATASADANCQAAVPNFASQVIATDNCTPSQALVIKQNPVAGTLLGLGQHPVIITVTDASGNSSTCSVLFTVADTTPPTILSTPAPFTLSAGPDCQAQVPNILSGVAANDSCTPATQLIKTQNPVAGSLVGIGNHTILITVTDGSGNSSSATVSFTVADTTPPSILSAPAPIKVSADSNCQGTVPNLLGSVLATDNCTPANQIRLAQNPVAGTVLPRGVYSVVLTATDASGNSSSVNVPLEIDDTTPPTILSSPTQVTVSADAHGHAAVPNVIAQVIATDNCTPANALVLTQNPVAGTILAFGQYTISVSVSDASGNTSTVKIPFAILDTTPPTIQSLTVSPSVLHPPNHQLVPVAVSATVSDNCDASPVTKIISITCNDVAASSDIRITGNLTATLAATKSSSGGDRVYTITVQSTDASGNSSTGVVTVTVPKSNGGNQGSGGARVTTLPITRVDSPWHEDHDRDRDDRPGKDGKDRR